jgi:hypothetical protein
VTSLTGVYPDRHGQAVSNSFRYYHPDGTTGTGVSFAYWTDGIFDPATATPSDTAPNMVTHTGLQAPAPWVPYTRAGCDFGAAGLANIELENTGPDVTKVFGPGRPRPTRPPRIRPRRPRTSSASPSTARRDRLPARAPRTLDPTCCPTSRAATPGSTPCSGTSTSPR